MTSNQPFRLGKYELGRTLGQGQFGKVKYGIDTVTKMEVAIKIMDKAKIQERHMGEQIKKEISIMKMINHPSVVRIIEVLSTASTIFLVLEYVPGGELFEGIVRNGRCEEDCARNYFAQLISAIEYCHAQGVCHRDLKPENLLLGANGELKITDFNLSRICSDENTVLQTACGTPNYVAPEVLKGEGYDGPPADIWSAGVILYVMLAGFLPFDELNMTDLFRKIVQADFSYPNWFSEDSMHLLSIILQPDPTKRAAIKDIKSHKWFKKGKIDTVSDEKEIPRLVPDKASMEQAITVMGEMDNDSSDYDSELDVTTSVMPTQFRSQSAGRKRAQTVGLPVTPISIPALSPQPGDRNLDFDHDINANVNLYKARPKKLDLVDRPLVSGGLQLSDTSFTIDLDSTQTHGVTGTVGVPTHRPGTKSAGSASSAGSKDKKKAHKPKKLSVNTLSPPSASHSLRPRGTSDSSLSSSHTQGSSTKPETNNTSSVGSSISTGSTGSTGSGAITLNAFDLINMVGGAAMNRMFQKGEKKMAFSQFSSSLPAVEIMDIMTDVLEHYPSETVSFQSFPKKCMMAMKVKSVSGPIQIQTQLYEMTPELHMIQMKNIEGDQVAFQRFYDQFKVDFLAKEKLKKSQHTSQFPTVTVSGPSNTNSNPTAKSSFLSVPERLAANTGVPISASPVTPGHPSPNLPPSVGGSGSPTSLASASPQVSPIPSPLTGSPHLSALGVPTFPSRDRSSSASPSFGGTSVTNTTPSRPTNLASLTVGTIMSGGGGNNSNVSNVPSAGQNTGASPIVLGRSLTPSGFVLGGNSPHSNSAPTTPVVHSPRPAHQPAHHSALPPLAAPSPVSLSASLAASIVATTLGASLNPSSSPNSNSGNSGGGSGTPSPSASMSTTSPPTSSPINSLSSSPAKLNPPRIVTPTSVSRPLFGPHPAGLRRSSDVAGAPSPQINVSVQPTITSPATLQLPNNSAVNAPPPVLPTLISKSKRSPLLPSMSAQHLDQVPALTSELRKTLSLHSQPVNTIPLSVTYEFGVPPVPSSRASASSNGPSLRKSISAPAESSSSTPPTILKSSSSPAQPAHPIAVRDSSGVNRFSISSVPTQLPQLSNTRSQKADVGSPTGKVIDV